MMYRRNALPGIQKKMTHFSDQFETSQRRSHWYLNVTNTSDTSKRGSTGYLKQSDPIDVLWRHAVH